LRAQLHELFAAWLERAAGEHVLEYEEILGFHLEQAYGYRQKLAPLDEEGLSLGARAGERLASAGQRAFARNDAPAAISLLDRALIMLPAHSPARPKLLCDLGLALSDLGDDFARAQAVLSEATTAAEALSEPALAAIATMRFTWVRLLAGGAQMDESRATIEESVHRLEELQDEDGLAEAYSFLGTMLMWKGRCADAGEVLERSASLARRTGADRVASRSLSWLLIGTIWGPMSVADGLVLCERIVAEGNDRYVEGFASFIQGLLLTMAGDWEEGRALLATGRAMLEELGQNVILASTRMASARPVARGRGRLAVGLRRTRADG
jgi:tetratricopeptide (TPR) repeat protein